MKTLTTKDIPESAKHTPGPWREDGLPIDDYRTIIDEQGNELCEVTPHNGEANARLIAAAPDMLAALRECLAYMDSLPDAPQGSIAEVGQCGARYIARQAIASAEGRQ